MNNVLSLKGQQEFMGKQIKIIEGGFGNNQRVMCDKTISEIHNVENREIRKSINRLIEKGRIVSNIDYIDLKSEGGKDFTSLEILLELGYSRSAITQAQNIFILSERGYSKLIKAMDDDTSWDTMDKLIDEYFTMREIINSEESLKNKLLLNLFSNDPIVVSTAHKQLIELETKPLIQTIEDQKPLVEIAQQRRMSDGLCTITDATKINNLKTGQISTWSKINHYIHASRKEVNIKGEGYFQVYGVEYPNIGITEQGMILIKDNLEDIKLSPCKYVKPKKNN